MTSLPSLQVEVDFAAAAAGDWLVFGDATRGKFGTGRLAGDATFVDVTSYVRSGSITRGISRFDGLIARAEAGRASVLLDNRDARFDPTNLAGPYVSGGATLVKPMRAWRVRADGHDLWRGFADSWDLSYPLSGKDALTNLTGTDGSKVLAQYDGAAVAPVGAGEDTGARITRVLNSAGWPAADRVIDVGLTTVQATTLAQPARTEMLLVADTELGELYFDGAGKVVFRNRHALLSETRSTVSNGIFGDAGSELPYQAVNVSYDDQLIRNHVRIARVGGTEQVVTDAASIAQYLTRTYERSDLIHQTDAESLLYAQHVLATLKDAELRVDTLTINPQADPTNLYPQVLGRELGDRITVRIRPVGRADTIERDAIIRGITHTWTPSTWITTWALQDASHLASYLVFGDSISGRLDYGRLAAF
jgi:hypothetical protein